MKSFSAAADARILPLQKMFLPEKPASEETTMERFRIIPGTIEDRHALAILYRAVAAVEGGLARIEEEITEDYISNSLKKSLESGVILVAREPETQQIIGEIHAYALGPKVFAHVLGELTIAVHPAHQGKGIGKALFTELLTEISVNRPDILRVELIARESNQRAIELYQKLGFRIEGRLVGRIRSVDGGFEADVPMAWHRNSL
jgi:ribosomal protein S18 acetylase RimI-like enzyme